MKILKVHNRTSNKEEQNFTNRETLIDKDLSYVYCTYVFRIRRIVLSIDWFSFVVPCLIMLTFLNGMTTLLIIIRNSNWTCVHTCSHVADVNTYVCIYSDDHSESEAIEGRKKKKLLGVDSLAVSWSYYDD